jgi:hypothetical protein
VPGASDRKILKIARVFDHVATHTLRSIHCPWAPRSALTHTEAGEILNIGRLLEQARPRVSSGNTRNYKSFKPSRLRGREFEQLACVDMLFSPGSVSPLKTSTRRSVSARKYSYVGRRLRSVES